MTSPKSADKVESSQHHNKKQWTTSRRSSRGIKKSGRLTMSDIPVFLSCMESITNYFWKHVRNVVAEKDSSAMQTINQHNLLNTRFQSTSSGLCNIFRIHFWQQFLNYQSSQGRRGWYHGVSFSVIFMVWTAHFRRRLRAPEHVDKLSFQKPSERDHQFAFWCSGCLSHTTISVYLPM